MKENSRKCIKCGSSPAEDPNISLHRFPKPGRLNSLRCELWAKYCFPNDSWSSPQFQNELYSKHLMLCTRHFKTSSFIDNSGKRLFKSAVPDEECDKQAPVSMENEPQPGPSYIRDITSTANILQDSAESTVAKRKRLNAVLMEIEPQAGPSNTTSTVSATATLTVAAAKQKEHVHISLETEVQKLKNKHLYTKCRKYVKKICQLRNTVKKIKRQHVLSILNDDENVENLAKRLTPSFAILLQGQMKNVKKNPKGRRWTQDEKILALRLFKRSPSCYRLLRRLFCLPAQSTLKTLLGQLSMPVGINQKVMEVLKMFVQKQNPADNHYVLMFDEMSIKKHLDYSKNQDLIEGYQDHGKCHDRSPQEATYALVFMVAGLRKTVKQPIAYYLSSAFVTADRLSVIIKQVLGHCFNAGINICATVCDMDGVNKRALTNLGASEQKPYITINGSEIVTLFDPPHLLKCFRNLFMKYDIKCNVNITSDDNSGQGLAKWRHIVDFYEKDSCNPNFVFAPCLKKEHLSPNTKQKMRVKLAAQVLSHSVAAGMYAKISMGELPSDAVVTANVVANMDKLFDCLNSSTPDLKGGKPYKTNLSDASPHLKFFQLMKKKFHSLNFVGCRSTPPSLSGWIWTLNGVELMWSNIKRSNPDIKSIATRRLQQDPLENLFGCIRANCGSNSNPTVGQFTAGLKTAILTNLTHMAAGNCEDDNNKTIVDNFKKLLSPTNKVTDSPSVEDESPLTSDMLSSINNNFDESVKEDSGEMQACAYVCGFLLRKMHTECSNCAKALYCDTDNTELELIHNFTQYREYNDLKKSLKYAARPFVECVEICATIINTAASTHGHKIDLKKKMVDMLNSEVNFEFLKHCPNHYQENVEYITRSVFYICIKRFCIMQNRKYAEQASMSSLKKKIDILKHV